MEMENGFTYSHDSEYYLSPDPNPNFHTSHTPSSHIHTSFFFADNHIHKPPVHKSQTTTSIDALSAIPEQDAHSDLSCLDQVTFQVLINNLFYLMLNFVMYVLKLSFVASTGFCQAQPILRRQCTIFYLSFVISLIMCSNPLTRHFVHHLSC